MKRSTGAGAEFMGKFDGKTVISSVPNLIIESAGIKKALTQGWKNLWKVACMLKHHLIPP